MHDKHSRKNLTAWAAKYLSKAREQQSKPSWGVGQLRTPAEPPYGSGPSGGASSEIGRSNERDS